MGWRFRKSFSPIPGLRLTLSPRGISTSIGAGPLRFTVGPQGAAVTARIPGTGIAFRQPFHSQQEGDSIPPALDVPEEAPPRITRPAVALPEVTEIRSASTAMLTSAGLKGVKDLITRAQDERSRLLPELNAARTESAALREKHQRWEQGWLLRRLFKKTFARLGEQAKEAGEKEAELSEQERLSRIATDFELPNAIRDVFGRLCDSTVALGKAQRIWDTVSTRGIDQFRERTTAVAAIERKPVRITLGGTDLVNTEWRVPHLSNANGGELLLYPGFIMYHLSNEAFALVDLREVKMEYAQMSFIEEQGVPSDAVVQGQAWKKANKDGSRDRRFADNYQIPVVVYGRIRITGESGLDEEYMISNTETAEEFVKAFEAFRQSVPPDSTSDS